VNCLFWHRRDLRIHDNAGLYKALSSGYKVQALFIFDSTILEKLDSNDLRVQFIHQEIKRLKSEYINHGSDLIVRFGDPVELIPLIAKEFDAKAVYTNRDYEPYAICRDKQIYETLKNINIDFLGSKDHVIFEKSEIIKSDGTPYTVFTPYSRKWKESLNDFYLRSYPTEKYLSGLIQKSYENLIPLKELGFSRNENFSFPDRNADLKIIQNYSQNRDFPSKNGTSRLSVHLRFGTISIRELTRIALKENTTWRDFYQMILFQFPYSAEKSFKSKYDRVVWETNENHFKHWCEGTTGYPLVDAGMRELNATGFMHNRVRMVVASFLTKHLLLDWRWGEAYFAEKLLDYEMASNVGGWQWAAGSGCDAAPYFRVFNPASQQEKFDKNLQYIKKWIPEFGTDKYPEPIVEHSFARNRAIDRYKTALNE
jgi:deoxyribodipyrimidine photo-lyase